MDLNVLNCIFGDYRTKFLSSPMDLIWCTMVQGNVETLPPNLHIPQLCIYLIITDGRMA